MKLKFTKFEDIEMYSVGYKFFSKIRPDFVYVNYRSIIPLKDFNYEFIGYTEEFETTIDFQLQPNDIITVLEVEIE